MNQRPSGYEPDELPDCSTPRQEKINILLSLHRVNHGLTPCGWCQRVLLRPTPKRS